MRVEIVDDTGRRTISLRGRKMQEKTRTVHVFEGQHLNNAIRRARRWMRNAHRRRDGIRGAPKHIALKLAAFHKAYPVDFERAMTDAAVA